MKLAPPINVLEIMGKGEEKTINFLHNLYHKTINSLFNNIKFGQIFLLGLVGAFFLAISMFWTTAVPVKMLPLDNKNLFGIVIDMPDGTSLVETASTLNKMAEVLRRNIPEVVSLQTYAGTSQPFDFNGLVRHYYLRNLSSMGEIQLQLLNKNKRSRSSHEIALEARRLIQDIAQQSAVNVAVVEMPPGPPVLRTVVAEYMAQIGLRVEN